jgi:hypothetical protein
MATSKYPGWVGLKKSFKTKEELSAHMSKISKRGHRLAKQAKKQASIK